MKYLTAVLLLLATFMFANVVSAQSEPQEFACNLRFVSQDFNLVKVEVTAVDGNAEYPGLLSWGDSEPFDIPSGNYELEHGYSYVEGSVSTYGITLTVGGRACGSLLIRVDDTPESPDQLDFSYTAPNKVCLRGFVNSSINVSWGDNSGWGTDRGQVDACHDYKLSQELGDYEVMVEVTGAVAMTETFQICWEGCGNDNSDNGDSATTLVATSRPSYGHFCEGPNPSNTLMMGTLYIVPGLNTQVNVKYGPNGVDTYNEVMFDIRDFKPNPEEPLAASRQILRVNPDGTRTHVGDVIMIDPLAPEPWARCLWRFADDGWRVIPEQ